MDLEGYLSEKNELINAALDRFLPAAGEAGGGFGHNLRAAMRYSVFAGGKRIRPILVLAAFAAAGRHSGGDTEDAAMPTACAFECVHTYSLIHDDLPAIDNDDVRRGKPACHRAFGEATAILAGDALLTMAFEMIALSPRVPAERLVAVSSELARAAGSAGMIGGQVVDIESEGMEVSLPAVEHIHIHKTGRLITAAIRCGAMIAGADETKLRALTRYGERVGLAFQIADDILNVECSPEELGKPAGSDEKRKKATYPALLGVKDSRDMAHDLVLKALAAIEDFNDMAEPLRAIAKFIVKRRK
ncbi:MAG: polyprenyl synthetase family protein [Deltaproteobacteria bacterium]|nr:polyprenyl synthetase family protein [Deltaproteobacteria bacterium]